MIEIRIHGRGGQGVVTAAELIAISAFQDGKYAQAFPFFGVERTGAPIEAYARINDKFIRTREHIYNPDVLIIQDSSLINAVDVFKGCKKNTKIIINTTKKETDTECLSAIDATKIALDILGKNIVNTVILGYFAKITGLISLNGLKKAIKEKFNEKGEEIVKKNIQAICIAYNTSSNV